MHARHFQVWNIFILIQQYHKEKLPEAERHSSRNPALELFTKSPSFRRSRAPFSSPRLYNPCAGIYTVRMRISPPVSYARPSLIINNRKMLNWKSSLCFGIWKTIDATRKKHTRSRLILFNGSAGAHNPSCQKKKNCFPLSNTDVYTSVASSTS